MVGSSRSGLTWIVMNYMLGPQNGCFHLRHSKPFGKHRNPRTGSRIIQFSLIQQLGKCVKEASEFIKQNSLTPFMFCLHFKAVDLNKCFPIIYHGDDADSHRRRSFCAVTIGSPLLVGRSSWDSKVLLYIIDVSKTLQQTFDALDSWVVYGLSELQEGRFFDVDVQGQPFSRGNSGLICGGYRGVMVAIKGDQKYLARALQIKANWKSEQVCPYCAASSTGDLCWTMFGPQAPHRSTLVTTEQFILRGCRPNPWIRLPGFDIQCLLQDWLHIVDLSYTPEVCASVLWFSFFWTL